MFSENVNQFWSNNTHFLAAWHTFSLFGLTNVLFAIDQSYITDYTIISVCFSQLRQWPSKAVVRASSSLPGCWSVRPWYPSVCPRSTSWRTPCCWGRTSSWTEGSWPSWWGSSSSSQPCSISGSGHASFNRYCTIMHFAQFMVGGNRYGCSVKQWNIISGYGGGNSCGVYYLQNFKLIFSGNECQSRII